jgi:hypothetical protein
MFTANERLASSRAASRFPFVSDPGWEHALASDEKPVATLRRWKNHIRQRSVQQWTDSPPAAGKPFQRGPVSQNRLA